MTTAALLQLAFNTDLSLFWPLFSKGLPPSEIESMMGWFQDLGCHHSPSLPAVQKRTKILLHRAMNRLPLTVF